MADDKKDMNANEQNEELEKKIEELMQILRERDKGTLKGEGFSVFSSLEEAKEYKRKMLERERQRIEKRKLVQENKKKAEDNSKD